jgi:HD-GYP domain-containing protein (c-di-GMP phosphodiesterase class II)
MHLSVDKIKSLRFAALIHDIGEVNLPVEITHKPSKLINVEFNLVKNHPYVGYDVLKDIDFSWPIAQIVFQHHEKIDGSGYPQGLKGDEILSEAKILCVADVIEAMSSYRSYRSAISIDKSLEEIVENKNVLFDPEVVDVCVNLFKDKGFKFEY